MKRRSDGDTFTLVVEDLPQLCFRALLEGTLLLSFFLRPQVGRITLIPRYDDLSNGLR